MFGMEYGVLMMMVLLGFLTTSNAVRLTKEENEKLLETCGTSTINGNKRSIINAPLSTAGEAPWSISVSISHDSFYEGTTGTLISDRHVLTNGQFFRHVTNLTCDGLDLVYPAENVSAHLVGLDLLGPNNQKVNFAVSSVKILKGCEEPSTMDRVALIELEKPIPTGPNTNPVCIKNYEPPMNNFTVHAYGVNSHSPSEYGKLRHTTVLLYVCPGTSPGVLCGNFTEKMCVGDYGAAVTQNFKGQVHAYGIVVNKPTECSKPNEYVNVVTLDSLSKRICDLTGVCPPIITTTTTTTTPMTPTTEVITPEDVTPTTVTPTTKNVFTLITPTTTLAAPTEEVTTPVAPTTDTIIPELTWPSPTTMATTSEDVTPSTTPMVLVPNDTDHSECDGGLNLHIHLHLGDFLQGKMDVQDV